MNSKVFERAMFKAENKPTKADSGIMQGFDEDYENEDLEAENDEMAEEVSKRTPNSPEILMNNLRGDMRSVDARYQELAEMVGEDVAMETPPEVLAMLQSQLGAQAAPAGIGALPTQGVPPPMPPGGAPMPTPPEMGGMPPAPPQMPQGPMPTDQGAIPPPQGFAYGGMVGSAPGYGSTSMMAPPMYQGAMAPQGFAHGGEVGNPAQGIQQFKNGGMVKQITDPNNPNNPVQKITDSKRIGPAQPAAQPVPLTPEQQQAELMEKRNRAFATPTVSSDPNKFANVNPDFLAEFVRRFEAGNQNRPAPQLAVMQTTPRFGALTAPTYPVNQGMPMYANGGVVDIPQAGANYSTGVSYSGPLEAGANYIKGAGRNGDIMLAHMKPEQHQILTMMGGGSTTNPKTGLPEHYLGAGAATNLMQRIQPYAQAANQYIGSRMAPVLTPPSIQQSRTTLGTFGPKTVEGMELTYPSLTQRIGTATEPARNYIANMPASQKALGALTTIPGGAAVMKAFGGGENVPNMPSSDVPAVIGTDEAGNRVYLQPPAPAAETPAPAKEASIVEQAMEPPTAPKTEAELIEKQGKKDKLENRLDAYMKENLPVFEKYMGGDKDASQIQALFLLADAGLEYATKPARTGMMALANAFKRMPAGLSQIAAQEEARKTQIRGAALTSGLQSIAAEDKATAALQREILKKAVSSGEVTPTDRGAGLTSYTNKQGEDKGMRLDPQVANSFLNSRFTPQLQKDKEGNVVGFNTPYARVSEGSQTINLDKSTRERLAGDVSRQEIAISKLDDAIKMYTDTAFGPKAFFSNFKNNVLVPVSPLKPNTLTEEQRTKINTAMNTAIKAIARAGDTGNIAVAEQTTAAAILGDKPGTFFSDYETALKRLMTVRTDLANQRLSTASQLGWINQDVQLDVPNLGTPSDPIPQDKLGYLTSLKAVNPNAQVYITINGRATPVLLSTLKD